MSDLKFEDVVSLLHPFLAVTVIFPLLGIVVYFAWQTRQRRVLNEADSKKIPALVGKEHLRIGRWLSNAVVLIALLGITVPIFTGIAKKPPEDSFRVWFLVLITLATVVSLVILNRARTELWRGVFATLTGMGMIILGSQPEVFRRGELFNFETGQWFPPPAPGFPNEWYLSHYYYGIVAAMLMIFSLAIFPDIYKDRTNRWRTTHVVLNVIAVLFFVGQGFTGSRDLLEIPLSWQTPHVYKCDFQNDTCPQ
jgi:membrane protein YdbS with pleckstrin-like domain